MVSPKHSGTKICNRDWHTSVHDQTHTSIWGISKYISLVYFSLNLYWHLNGNGLIFCSESDLFILNGVCIRFANSITLDINTVLLACWDLRSWCVFFFLLHLILMKKTVPGLQSVKKHGAILAFVFLPLAKFIYASQTRQGEARNCFICQYLFICKTSPR